MCVCVCVCASIYPSVFITSIENVVNVTERIVGNIFVIKRDFAMKETRFNKCQWKSAGNYICPPDNG